MYATMRIILHQMAIQFARVQFAKTLSRRAMNLARCIILSFLGLLFTYSTVHALSPAQLPVIAQSSGAAQSLSHDELIASYLYNFIKHVSWPDQEQFSAISIGIFDPEDLELANKIASHFGGAKLDNSPIQVDIFSDPRDISRYQLLLLGPEHNADIFTIYDAIGARPILLVSTEQKNKQLVMINLYTTGDSRMRFEINKANLLNHGLTINTEIILNGGSEIDVARLFRDGQASLVVMQKQLQERELSLRAFEVNIDKLKRNNTDLAKNLRNLQNNIDASNKLISDQQVAIAQQKERLEATNRERILLQQAGEQQTKELNLRQTQLDEIAAQIQNRENQLDQLNSTLSLQQQRMSEMGETIATQNFALINLVVLLLLVLVLVSVAVWAYINKKRDNEHLSLRGEELKLARDRLAIAKIRAENANRAKSEFLSTMSHELRTPLQAIIGYTDVVMEDLKFEGLEHHSHDLGRVINNSQRLLKLINGSLDLAKIESGRMELHLTPVRLSLLVEEALSGVRPQISEKQLKLKVATVDGEALPKADPEKLLHILLNLLANACKFTEQGTISVTAEHQPTQIYIEVTDTGVGIPPEQLGNVFNRFTQADSSPTRKYQGTGLGLAIAKQFAELMGGAISVKSEFGRGSSFYISIPLPIIQVKEEISDIVNYTDLDDATLDFVELEGVGNERSARLLLIDDDLEFLNIMARTLRKENYQVFTAATADEGMRLALLENPDLITLDLLLPDMHGWELFKKIKENTALSKTPIIIASVLDDRVRSQEYGADDFLAKPVAITTLKLAVEKIMSAEGATHKPSEK
jgi:Signal transduction histidine kinase